MLLFSQVKSMQVPAWQFVVGTLGALTALGVVVLVMYCCGCFKRKRKPTKEEAAEEELANLKAPEPCEEEEKEEKSFN